MQTAQQDLKLSSFFQNAREAMIVSQLMPNKITKDTIFQAFSEIPREVFAPSAKAAYADTDLFFDSKRFMLSAMVQAQLFSIADFTGVVQILDVGCAAGYSTCLLEKISGGANITAIEEDKKLLERAQSLFKGADFLHRQFDGSDWDFDQQFDLIFCEGEVKALGDAHRKALKEGGMLYCIQKDRFGSSFITRYLKKACHFSGKSIMQAFAPLLWDPKQNKKQDFSF